MKLVQLNIWQGRLLREVLKFLEQEQPDFMCLQEVYSSNISTRTHDFLGGFEKIQALFPAYHSYFSAVCDIPVFDQKVLYGNALLSRFPLANTETHFIDKQSHSYKVAGEYTANEGQDEPSNVQCAVIQLGRGKSFCLVNHHGYWEPSRIGSEVSVQKMEQVAKIIENSRRPLIFAGDLNVVAESPAMKPIQSQLRDLTQEYGLPTTLTELGKVKDVACDHICVSDSIQVKSFAASDVLVSDHKALVLEFDIT